MAFCISLFTSNECYKYIAIDVYSAYIGAESKTKA